MRRAGWCFAVEQCRNYTVIWNAARQAGSVSASPFLGMSRRQFLAKAAGAGAAAFLTDWAAPVIEKAYGVAACPGHLTDIEHIVLLMQETGHSITISARSPAPTGSAIPWPRRRFSNNQGGILRHSNWTQTASRFRFALTPPEVPY
jgi:hypothetical protein